MQQPLEHWSMALRSGDLSGAVWSPAWWSRLSSGWEAAQLQKVALSIIHDMMYFFLLSGWVWVEWRKGDFYFFLMIATYDWGPVGGKPKIRWGMTPETEARWCGSDAAGQLELPWGVSSKLHRIAFAFAFEVGDHLRRFTSVLSGCLALRAIKGAT